MSSQDYQYEGRPEGRLARLKTGVKNAIRKVLLGYDPAEEEELEREGPAAAMLGHQVANPRLEGDAAAARLAANKVVAEDQDMLNELVQLDVTRSASPLDEDLMASLRRRIENGPADESVKMGDLDADDVEEMKAAALKKRMQAKSRQARTQGSTSSATLERPQQRRSPKPNASAGGESQKKATKVSRPQKPAETPKLASADDAARLARMFGATGSSSGDGDAQ